MEAWSVQDVAAWLAGLNLHQYVEKFMEVGVDGLLLANLTEEDLKGELGVQSSLHRKKVLLQVQRQIQGNADRRDEQHGVTETPQGSGGGIEAGQSRTDIVTNQKLKRKYLQLAEEKSNQVSFIDENAKRALLVGDVRLELQPPKTKAVLFLSSTFVDTKFEMDYLMEHVFPFLDQFAKLLRLQFHVVSMRWGVRSRAASDHMTVELCLSQLKESLASSVGIAYVNLQSHRYGYRPFPNKIECVEFDSIVSALRGTPHAEAAAEYLAPPYWLRDETAVPEVYRLQPISSLPGCEYFLLSDDEKDRGQRDSNFKKVRMEQQSESSSRWWGTFEKMQLMLREGASLCLTVQDQQKYLTSVTHLEVNHGLLYNVDAATQCCYFERNIEGIDSALATDKIASLYKDSVVDSTGAKLRLPDVQLERYLNDLKDQIRRSLQPSRVFLSSVPWVSNGALQIDSKNPPAEWQAYLESFGVSFIGMICDSILSEFKNPDPSPLVTELSSQLHLVRSKLQYSGFSRDDVIRGAVAYCNDADPRFSPRRALVLYGPSGSGKSWIMSKIIQSLNVGSSGKTVIYRMLGTTKDSSDALSVIRSVMNQCSQLGNDYNDSEMQEWNDCSADFERCSHIVRSQESFTVLVLDSIDQLSTDYGALDSLADWLPGLKSDLPHNVRVIYSTLEEDKGKKLLQQINIGLSDVHDEGFNNCVDVPPIEIDEATLELFCACFPEEGVQFPTKRKLSPSVKHDLMNCIENNSTPLFAKLCLDIVLRWPSYISDSDRASLMRISHSGDGVKGLISLIFANIEERHGKKFVSTTLGLITAAKEGLSESELEDILSCDDDVLDDVYEWWTPPYRRVPPMLVQRLVMDLGDYIISRGSKGGGMVLNWYHRQFWEAANQRYLNTDAQRARIHSLIATYFSGASPGDRFIDPQELRYGKRVLSGRINFRRCSELSFAKRNANLQQLVECSKLLLCDIVFIIAKVESGLVNELVEDYIDVTKLLKKYKAPVSKDFSAFRSWVIEAKHRWCEGHVSVLQSALFLPDANVVFKKATQLLSQIDVTELSSSGKYLLSYRHGKTSAMSQCAMTIPGFAGGVTSACVSLDGSVVFVACGNVIKLFDVLTGSRLFSFSSHSDLVTCVRCSSSGAVLSTSDDGTIRLWDMKTMSCDMMLSTHTGVSVKCASFSDDGRMFVTGAVGPDAVCTLWDAESGEQLNTFLCTNSSANIICICISADNKLIAAGTDEANICFWSITGVEAPPANIALYSEVLGIAFNRLVPNNKEIFACDIDRNQVMVLDVDTGAELRQFWGHEHRLGCICLSTDGKLLVSGSYDNSVRVWDSQSGVCLSVLKGHTYTIAAVGIAQNNSIVISCDFSNDASLKIWDNSEESRASVFQQDRSSVSETKSEVFAKNAGSLIFSNDKSVALFKSWYGPMEIWRVGDAGDAFINAVDIHEDQPLYGKAVGNDGSRFAYAPLRRAVKVWDALSGQLLFETKDTEPDITYLTLAFTANNSMLVGSTAEHHYAWNSDGQIVWKVPGLNGWTSKICISQDNLFAVLGAQSGYARVLDVSTGESIKTIHTGVSIRDVSLFPSSGSGVSSCRLLIGGGTSFGVWDMSDDSVSLKSGAHRDSVEGVDVSSDGTLLLTSSRDRTVKLWDAATKACVASYRLDDMERINTWFIRDSKSIAVTDVTGKVSILDFMYK